MRVGRRRLRTLRIGAESLFWSQPDNPGQPGLLQIHQKTDILVLHQSEQLLVRWRQEVPVTDQISDYVWWQGLRQPISNLQVHLGQVCIVEFLRCFTGSGGSWAVRSWDLRSFGEKDGHSRRWLKWISRIGQDFCWNKRRKMSVCWWFFARIDSLARASYFYRPDHPLSPSPAHKSDRQTPYPNCTHFDFFMPQDPSFFGWQQNLRWY